MKRVLVLDASQRSALAVTRSLGKQGIPVVTSEETEKTLAGNSRYSIQHVPYPSPRLYPEDFIQALSDLVKAHRIKILLPMTELTAMLLLQHQHRFSGTILPFPDMNTVNSLSDKCTLMRSAENLGIPVPRTWYCDNPTALPFHSEELPYPVVLKPGKSWLEQNGEWLRAGVRFADNPKSLNDIIANEPGFQSHPFMVQEYVSGEGQGVFALYDRGNAISFFAHRRLREKPPSGGVSVLSESIAVDPVLGAHARTLLDSAGWHGIAMVEFKVAEDGTPYLMEINTRFWGSLQLAIDAEVDFPWLLYQLACCDRPDPADSYKVGIRLRWLLGDLDNLYLTLRDKKYSFGTKLGALGHFITPSPFRTRHEVNRWSDPGPAWYEVKQYLRDIVG